MSKFQLLLSLSVLIFTGCATKEHYSYKSNIHNGKVIYSNFKYKKCENCSDEYAKNLFTPNSYSETKHHQHRDSYSDTQSYYNGNSYDKTLRGGSVNIQSYSGGIDSYRVIHTISNGYNYIELNGNSNQEIVETIITTPIVYVGDGYIYINESY
jgi:hypothetical protein